MGRTWAEKAQRHEPAGWKGEWGNLLLGRQDRHPLTHGLESPAQASYRSLEQGGRVGAAQAYGGCPCLWLVVMNFQMDFPDVHHVLLVTQTRLSKVRKIETVLSSGAPKL